MSRLRVERVVPTTALLAAIALLLVETPIMAAAGVPVALAFVLALLHTGALTAAARVPHLAAAVALLAVCALQVLSEAGTAVWPWPPVLVVTETLVLAVVATRTVLPLALLHWLLAVGSSSVIAAVLRPAASDRTSVDVVVFGSISAAAILVALLLTQWHRVRRQLIAERRTVAEQAAATLVAEERSRIARELHDVVAHRLSIITVQAATARFRHQDLDGAAADELDRVAAQSRQALDEMRGLLRVLRGTEASERSPQPTLADVPDLVRGARAAGARIALDQPSGDWRRGIGALTELTAFRVVQEAVSNALRHAPGADVEVRLRRGAGEVSLTVTNGPSETRSVVDPSGPGHGIVGMRERVAGAGGSIRLGETADLGFVVHAELPVGPGAVVA